MNREFQTDSISTGGGEATPVGGRWALLLVLLLGLVHMGVAGYKLYVVFPGLREVMGDLSQVRELTPLMFSRQVAFDVWFPVFGVLAGMVCGLLLLLRRGWGWAIILAAASLSGNNIDLHLLLPNYLPVFITAYVLIHDRGRVLFRNPPSLPLFSKSNKPEVQGMLRVLVQVYLWIGMLLVFPGIIFSYISFLCMILTILGEQGVKINVPDLVIMMCISCYCVVVGGVYLNIYKKLGWYNKYQYCRLWAVAQIFLVPVLGTVLGLVTLVTLNRPEVREQFPDA